MSEKKVSLLELNSNSNIGLYMFANDKFCLIGEEISIEKKKEIENVLKVPVYKITVLGTSLIGVFLAGNNDYLIIPSLYDYEKKEIQVICEKYGIDLLEFNEKLNTYGNNLSIGSKNIIASADYSKTFLKKLEKITKKSIKLLSNKDFSSAGALCKYLNGKYFISQSLGEKDVFEFVDEIAAIGTVNSGGLFISSGIVGNSNGLLLGSISSSIEIQNIVESLDYI